jgi:hypothetical protein
MWHLGVRYGTVITRDQIIILLNQNIVELKRRYSVHRIGLFGSFARGEATGKSDIDFIVEFEQATFNHYMDLKFYLEGLFHQEVDLVLSDSLKPRLKPYIEKEIIYAQGL